MKVVVQYFCNLRIKKKQSTSYPLSTIIRLLTQIVYLIEYYLFQKKKKKFQSNLLIYSNSFMTGVFPSVLKTEKVVPVFKKDSKLDYSNYYPISLLSNIEKIHERLMYRRLYTFLDNKNIIYNLQFRFNNILHLMS